MIELAMGIYGGRQERCRIFQLCFSNKDHCVIVTNLEGNIFKKNSLYFVGVTMKPLSGNID